MQVQGQLSSSFRAAGLFVLPPIGVARGGLPRATKAGESEEIPGLAGRRRSSNVSTLPAIQQALASQRGGGSSIHSGGGIVRRHSSTGSTRGILDRGGSGEGGGSGAGNTILKRMSSTGNGGNASSAGGRRLGNTIIQ